MVQPKGIKPTKTIKPTLFFVRMRITTTKIALFVSIAEKETFVYKDWVIVILKSFDLLKYNGGCSLRITEPWSAIQVLSKAIQQYFGQNLGMGVVE